MLDNRTRDALDAIRSRINQTAAIAMVIGTDGDCDKQFLSAFNGIGETLSELAVRLDVVTNGERTDA